MSCLLWLAAVVAVTVLEALPIDWLFLPKLINDTLILWGID